MRGGNIEQSLLSPRQGGDEFSDGSWGGGGRIPGRTVREWGTEWCRHFQIRVFSYVCYSRGQPCADFFLNNDSMITISVFRLAKQKERETYK